MPGVPFSAIERLATPGVIAKARELVRAKQQRERASALAETFFRSSEHLLSDQAYRVLRTAVKHRQVPAEVAGEQPTIFTNYATRAALVSSIEIELEAILETELGTARARLLESAQQILPAYSLFGGIGFSERLPRLLAGPVDGSRRGTRERERDRLLLLYLQRTAAKNDTLSEFGPTGWGKIDLVNGINLKPRPGIARREAFLERWTAHAVAAAISADPESFAELSPRLNPNGRIDNGAFVAMETEESLHMGASQLDLVGRCDGRTPVHALNAPIETIRSLVEQNILWCRLEVPALEPNAFAVLCHDIRKWRPETARTKWLSILEPIADLPAKFTAAARAKDRQEILNTARTQLQSLGIERKTGERSLYSASNPIGEECFRDCGFSIADNLINEVAVEAAPWIDLWRDSYAFMASRVAAGLRNVVEKMPTQNGAAPLPAFLHACEAAKLSLTGPGLVALAHIGFQEVKTAFREMIKPHADDAEYELTANDCHFVRREFQYPKFDEYTFPSADLQIAAKSTDAVARGEYQWILAELHPPVALLQHCMYWACPDKPALTRALLSTTYGRPNFHFGFFAADFTAHTTVRLFDAVPEITNFVATHRGNANWNTVPPWQTEVYVDETNGDVCLRKIDNHEYLGSFARNWIIPLGFHPFQFGMAPHMPRLRCGKVVVQRRTWVVTADEFSPGKYTGVSRDLVLAVERLRAERDLPRYAYIRPTEQALRRSGAEGRDKDTKPVFVDLESYLFLEIFHRWLIKSGELEVTEMLPDPDHLLWREPDGRRTFELRTLIVPRP
ncbi:MAG: hypothetical protein ABI925_04930 [Verrucomicrobiota bacterium]